MKSSPRSNSKTRQISVRVPHNLINKIEKEAKLRRKNRVGLMVESLARSFKVKI